MKKLLLQRPRTRRQFIISFVLVAAVAALGLFVHNLLGYRVVAFMLLVTVSILAMFLDIFPVLLAALLSALIWDFFFIPPRFTLTVGAGEDRLLLLMYFLVAMINGVLTNKIRQMEKEVKAKDEKEKSLKFYTTLFNSLTHELRTPITTILGCADNLQANSPRLLEKHRADLISEISVASIRLNQQIENLLSMSRVESGMLQIREDWCDISDLIYKAIERLEPNLERYRVSAHISETLPLFKLDFGLMEQVIHNLILNVTQHTPEDTLITIQANCIRKSLVLVIADNGSGFPDNEIDKVFDKFYRIQGAGPGGTGLGLSIVKGFVEAHNGTVKVDNLPVRGSKFTIEIPAEQSHVNRRQDE